jgi:hypothetical protein
VAEYDAAVSRSVRPRAERRFKRNSRPIACGQAIYFGGGFDQQELKNRAKTCIINWTENYKSTHHSGRLDEQKGTEGYIQ